MKKVLTLLLCLVLCFGLVCTFAACEQTPEQIEEKLQDSEARAEYVETIYDSAERFELKASYSNVKKNSDNSTSDDETFYVYALADTHDINKINADLYLMETGASEVAISYAVLIRDNEIYMFQGAIKPATGEAAVTKDTFVAYISAHISDMEGAYLGSITDMIGQLPPAEGDYAESSHIDINGLLAMLGTEAGENSAFATNLLAIFLNKVQVNGKQVVFSVDVNLLIDTLFGYAKDLINIISENAQITLSELYHHENVTKVLNSILRNVKGAEVEALLNTMIASGGAEVEEQLPFEILKANDGESAYGYIARYLDIVIPSLNQKVGDLPVATILQMITSTEDISAMLKGVSAELDGLKAEVKSTFNKLLPEYNISVTFENKQLVATNVSVKVDSSNGEKNDVHNISLDVNVKSAVELMDTTKIDLAALKAAAAQ